MQKETIEKLNQIQRQMNTLKMIKDRVDNEKGHFKLTFGIAINENQNPFCPIINEEPLTNELIAITKKYVDSKLAELQKELDNL